MIDNRTQVNADSLDSMYNELRFFCCGYTKFGSACILRKSAS
jgi:hypothetical protein